MTQGELVDFNNLQEAFDTLNKMYESMREELVSAHEAQKQGAIFYFNNGVEKFAPVFATSRGIRHNNLRPYKVMLTFDATALKNWIIECQSTLDKSQEPDTYIPEAVMPEPPKTLTDKS